jgi:hypothetical protein
MTWRPDPSFYPSPRMAMKAPAEKFAYVAAFDPTRQKPDAIAVVDVDPGSKTYANILGNVEMPSLGDELHHFGWNACSSCLCPNAPHPHVERRYLVVPGLRSSRIHILDTKPDPRQPKIVKVIEPEEIAEKTGYTRPHTIHCGPGGIYVAALGDQDGKAPGGIFMIDHESFEPLGRWEVERGPQRLSYDVWWHLGYDTLVTSEWGTPDTFENGLVPEVLLGGKYGRRLHFWDFTKRKHLQEIDLGPEYQLVFELRPAHDPTKAYGFVNSVISLDMASRRRQMGGHEDHRHSGRAGRSRQAAVHSQGFQGGSAVRHRHRSVDGRPLPLRRLLGHRRRAAVRRVRSVQAQAHRQVAHRRRRVAREPSGRQERRAQRRTADGRGQPGRQARVFHKLALRQHRLAIVSRWNRRLDGEARRKARRRHCVRSEILRRVAEDASTAPGPARRRRLLLGFILLSVKQTTDDRQLRPVIPPKRPGTCPREREPGPISHRQWITSITRTGLSVFQAFRTSTKTLFMDFHRSEAKGLLYERSRNLRKDRKDRPRTDGW